MSSGGEAAAFQSTNVDVLLLPLPPFFSHSLDQFRLHQCSDINLVLKEFLLRKLVRPSPSPPSLAFLLSSLCNLVVSRCALELESSSVGKQRHTHTHTHTPSEHIHMRNTGAHYYIITLQSSKQIRKCDWNPCRCSHVKLVFPLCSPADAKCVLLCACVCVCVCV